MLSSFLLSVIFLILDQEHIYSTTSAVKLVITVAVTTVCWLLAAYLAPQTERRTLIEFYRKVRPTGPGWEVIRQEAGISKTEIAQTGDNIPQALLGWTSGYIVIWSALFAIGNYLYGRIGYALALSAVFAISGLILISVVNKLLVKSER